MGIDTVEESERERTIARECVREVERARAYGMGRGRKRERESWFKWVPTKPLTLSLPAEHSHSNLMNTEARFRDAGVSNV